MTSVRWLLRSMGADGWRLVAAALLGTLTLGCSIGLMATSAWLISRAAQHPPVLYLTVAIVAVRAFGIGRGVLRYCERLVGHDAAFRVLARSRVGAYEDLEAAAPAGLGGLRSGDVLSRVVDDVESLQDLIVRGLLPIAVAVLTSVATVGLLAALLPEAGVVLLVGLLLAGLVAPSASLALAGRSELRASPARGALAESVAELLRGAADLVAHRAAGRWLERIRTRDAVVTALARRSATGAGVGAGLTTAALGATVLGELYVGVGAVQSGRLDGVLLAVLVLTPLAAFELVTPLPGAAQQLVRGWRAVERLRVLEELPRPGRAGGHGALPDRPLTLTVRDLHVGWPGSAPVLHGVNLSLTPGRRVAVIGESGAGKSTLAAALLGFLAPDAGTIALNGVDVATLDQAGLRRAIGVCAQDAYVFDSTIRNNLLIGRPNATSRGLVAALERARLADWVARQPHGLDTTVGERGVRLSGGERQRLALARTLLNDPEIVVLDEPTAHLDEPTAAALTRDLLDATRGRTTVLFTHRLAGLEDVDEVLVLSEGRLGPVRELVGG